jgi:hypothetical protein
VVRWFGQFLLGLGDSFTKDIRFLEAQRIEGGVDIWLVSQDLNSDVSCWVIERAKGARHER